jgi:hypothetical protein
MTGDDTNPLGPQHVSVQWAAFITGMSKPHIRHLCRTGAPASSARTAGTTPATG